MPKRNSMIIQSVLLDKKKYKSKRGAVSWIKKNDFSGIKIHETGNYYRFRQMSPDSFKQTSLRTVKKNGVVFIMGKLKSAKR